MSDPSPEVLEATKAILGELSSRIEDRKFTDPPFDKERHSSESRFKITTLVLWWYFGLIAGSFLFVLIYNFLAAHFNYSHLGQSQAAKLTPITYLDVASVVGLITSTLGSPVGFVIGYYFKNKNEI